ncbi:MAG: CpaF family protein [Anaerolineae bacterium]
MPSLLDRLQDKKGPAGATPDKPEPVLEPRVNKPVAPATLAQPPAGPPPPAATSTPPAAPGDTHPPAQSSAEPALPASQPAPAVEPKPLSAEDVAREKWQQLRRWATERVQGAMPPEQLTSTPETTARIGERINILLQTAGVILPDSQITRLKSEVTAELIGLGPLDFLLADATVTEIMVNGPKMVFVERKGRFEEIDLHFDDADHLMRVIERITRPLGRRADGRSPIVDARLQDGSYVNVIVPPGAIDGPVLTIRKFTRRLALEELVKLSTLTSEMAEFLRACVVSRLNIVVAGGRGSGKTTLLNALANFIPEGERIVTIEDTAEMQLNKRQVVRLESKSPEQDGSGRLTLRDLVANSLRLRPNRLIIGECSGPEALNVLQALNSGHDGSLTTIYANLPRDVISHLETMCLMARPDLPLKLVREQIAGGVDLIIQLARLRDGSRRIVQITEVQGMEGEIVMLQDIFHFADEGTGGQGKVSGALRPTGVWPNFIPRLRVGGFDFKMEMFNVPMLQTNTPRK